MFPIDIISIIYQYTCTSIKELEVLKSYSREWHIAGTLKTSYNNIILCYNNEEQNLEKLVENYPHIKHVKIFNTYDSLNYIMRKLVEFRSLSTLELNSSQNSIKFDEGFNCISSYPSLTSLIILDCFLNIDNFTALPKCKSLFSLTLSGFYLPYTSIMSSIKQCSSLSSLTIVNNYFSMTDHELCDIGEITTLSNVYFTGNCNISNEIVEYLTSKKIKVVIEW